MNVNDIKTFLGVLNQANPPVLLLLAASVVYIVLGFSWVVATYLRNKELSTLVAAINRNTNSVNLLLELTKLMFSDKYQKSMDADTSETKKPLTD